MNAFEDFKFGLIKPIQDAMYSVIIYALVLVLRILESYSASMHSPFPNSVSWIVNSITLPIIYIILSTLEEITLDIRVGYSKPFNAIARIFGIVCGTILFWGALMQIMTIIGGSTIDLLESFIIAVGSLIFGVYLRTKIAQSAS